MMTRETDILSDVVMNALWFSDRYLPTKGQTEDELNPGKLAREYVVFFVLLPFHPVHLYRRTFSEVPVPL